MTTQKLKLWPNSNCVKTIFLKCDQTKNLYVTKLKNSSCDKTKKKFNCEKKNSNCDSCNSDSSDSSNSDIF